jgi:hypothetical protein
MPTPLIGSLPGFVTNGLHVVKRSNRCVHPASPQPRVTSIETHSAPWRDPRIGSCRRFAFSEKLEAIPHPRYPIHDDPHRPS